MTAFDSLTLRRTLGQFATGVAIAATVDTAGRPVGLTINSFASLSLDPPLVLWSINRHTPSCAAFEANGHFAVNVLKLEQKALSNRFAASGDDKFAGVAWQPGLGGAPLIDGCLARLQCRLEQTVPGGDHLLLIGRVEALDREDGEPLLFFSGGYYELGRSAGGWD